MGKYQDELNALYDHRAKMERIYDSTLNTFGYLMTDTAKQYNEQRHRMDMESINREITEAEKAALQERAEEIAAAAMEQIAKGSGKAAQQIKAEIDKIFK